MQLRNKTILITGGTSGIGRELVKQLCENNHVIVIARNPLLTNDFQGNTRSIDSYTADLSDRMQLESAADKVTRKYSTIDVLINNAAIQNTPELLSDEFEYDSIQREVNLNFTAICQLVYLMLPLMKKESPSVILNINSGLALSPKRSSAIYCATKGALNIFSQSLGYQLNRTNISVQQAFLPLVETKMTVNRGENKLTTEFAAKEIIRGIQRNQRINDIGKVKLLRILLRLAPSIAQKMMQNN